MTMSSLSDFTDKPEIKPPHLKPENEVKTTTPDGTKFVGHGGSVPERDTFGFHKPVNKQQHFFKVYDGWAISDDALALIEKMGATLIFIADSHTGHVWEYTLEDYTEHGTTVDEKYRQHPDDYQTVVSADNPRYLWRGHQSEIVLPRDAEVEISDHPFKPASDYLDKTSSDRASDSTASDSRDMSSSDRATDSTQPTDDGETSGSDSFNGFM